MIEADPNKVHIVKLGCLMVGTFAFLMLMGLGGVGRRGICRRDWRIGFGIVGVVVERRWGFLLGVGIGIGGSLPCCIMGFGLLMLVVGAVVVVVGSRMVVGVVVTLVVVNCINSIHLMLKLKIQEQ